MLRVKIDPGTQANTIPFSQHKNLFPNKITKAGNHKEGSLQPTDWTWISHDSIPQPFLGQFIVDIQHKSQITSYPT